MINTRATPDWDVAVQEITNGTGADCVIEVGGAATLARSAAATRNGGRISIVGFLGGQQGSGIEALTVLARQLRIYGISIGSRAHFEALLEAMAVQNVHPVIDRCFGFEAFKEAYARLESGQHMGKVVIGLE